MSDRFSIYDEEYDKVRYDKGIHDFAIRSKERLIENNNRDFKELILIGACAGGLEIWLDVFGDNPEMCGLLEEYSDVRKVISDL